MQLTNIARDVLEDKNRNRKYINSNFETIEDTIKFADIFYKRSFSAISEIPFLSRFAILVARRVYREIGNEILKKKNMENYKSAGKIYVSSLGKFNQTILSILDMFNLYYNYDLTTSKLRFSGANTHEIMIGFKSNAEKSRKKNDFNSILFQ